VLALPSIFIERTHCFHRGKRKQRKIEKNEEDKKNYRNAFSSKTDIHTVMNGMREKHVGLYIFSNDLDGEKLNNKWSWTKKCGS
jgi:hypothetical protein